MIEREKMVLFPPFCHFSWQGMEQLCANSRVCSLQPGQLLIEEKSEQREELFFCVSGELEVWRSGAGQSHLTDRCVPGDLIGAREVLTGQPQVIRVRAVNEVLLYALPGQLFLKLLEESGRASLAFALSLAKAVDVLQPAEDRSHDAPLPHRSERVSYMRTEDALSPKPVTDLVTCSPTTTVRDAARLMRRHDFGSAIVLDAERHPLGIVIESDVVRKIVADALPPETPLSSIMSTPVPTIGDHATVAQIVVTMTRDQTNHLVVTEDGTPGSPVIGIISEHDVLLMHGNHPAVLVKRLAAAATVEELAQLRNRADELIYGYLSHELQVPFVTQVITEINGVLVERAINIVQSQLVDEGPSCPNVPFCWLSLGSDGRREQLLRTDQDNGILYANPEASSAESTRAYFLELGRRVVDVLIACGFERCPGDVMASNPEWVQPLNQWKRYFRRWIGVSDQLSLRKMSIFFDFRPIYGEAALTEELTAAILDALEGNERFLYFFVESALQHPAPRGFFGNLLLENSGENRNRFDLKARGLRPLDHAARVLVLAQRVAGVTNTIARYEALAERLPDSTLFGEAAMAYAILSRYRALNGLRHGNDGRYLAVRDLNQIERETLKTCFRTIEQLQKYLRLRFGLRGR